MMAVSELGPVVLSPKEAKRFNSRGANDSFYNTGMSGITKQVNAHNNISALISDATNCGNSTRGSQLEKKKEQRISQVNELSLKKAGLEIKRNLGTLNEMYGITSSLITLTKDLPVNLDLVAGIPYQCKVNFANCPGSVLLQMKYHVKKSPDARITIKYRYKGKNTQVLLSGIKPDLVVLPPNTFPNTTIPVEQDDLVCIVSISSEADINVELTAKNEVIIKTKTPLRSRSEVVSLE